MEHLYTYSSDKPYKYQNLRLTPESFVSLMIYLFDHTYFTQDEVIEQVRNHHEENGGDCSNIDWNNLFISAVENILNPYIVRVSDDVYMLSYASYDGLVDDMELDETFEAETTRPIYCDLTIGNGQGAVYVYYYETYKQQYQSNGYDVWPCKIGMSMGDPLRRIFAQTSTPAPECPHPALIIYTDKPKELETMLHAALQVQDKQMKNCIGREWFLTTPEIIKDLYERLISK